MSILRDPDIALSYHQSVLDSQLEDHYKFRIQPLEHPDIAESHNEAREIVCLLLDLGYSYSAIGIKVGVTVLSLKELVEHGLYIGDLSNASIIDAGYRLLSNDFG